MKKLTKMLAAFALLVGVFGVAANQKETVVAEAATPQTHRRIYVTLLGDWTLDQMYISYFGGNIETQVLFNDSVLMTQVVNDYNTGLFYYDVPIDHTTFLVRKNTGTWDGDHNQSVDIAISSLFEDSNYLAAAIGGWAADGLKRTFTAYDNLPGNSGQIAAILSHIDSCSPSYAGGYNAWPQINDLFITPSEKKDFDTQALFESSPYNSTQPKISEKIAYLESRYTIDQATPSGSKLSTYNLKKSTPLVVVIGTLSLTALAGFYFLKTKKQ